MLEDFDLKKLVEPLQNWFGENARVLPWREEPTAYHVWVSEIMLQQTRVEAVKPYYDRFMNALPDVKALSECPEDKLLKLWEGLGYYNRVRNLKTAAITIMEEYDGTIPSDYKDLLKLKGIGSYTAGAISSIAYGQPVPAVDGNVLRVISRVTADDRDIMKQSVRKNMENLLLELMLEGTITGKTVTGGTAAGRSVTGRTTARGTDAVDTFQKRSFSLEPAIWNQALMELGATVCVPNGEPHCKECPWQDMCQAKALGLIDQIPVKTKAKQRRIEEKTVLIIKDGDQLALHKRPSKGLLAGLYELPNLEGHVSTQEIINFVEEKGYKPIRIQPVGDAKHIFSHVEWHMKGYVVFLQAKEYGEADSEKVENGSDVKMQGTSLESVENAEKDIKGDDWIFVDVEETKKDYAIPSAFVKYTEYLNLVIGKEAISNSK